MTMTSSPPLTMTSSQTEDVPVAVPSLQERFTAAVDIVQNMPKEGPVTSSTDEKLAFYSLFKQATLGPCNVPKPSIWNVVERYKWDAWNKLGEMGREEAMETYLKTLLQKIDEVNKTYDTKEWMTGDLHEQLKPKFALIGRTSEDMVEVKEVAEVSVEGERQSGDQDQDTIVPSTFEEEEEATEKDPLTEMSTLSDAEYCDAIDDDDHLPRSRVSSYELHDESVIGPATSEATGSDGRVERELKRLSDQIEKLSQVVETKHNQLMDTLKKAIVSWFVPRGVSWRTVVFFIFWPFITHFVIRYFRRYLAIK